MNVQHIESLNDVVARSPDPGARDRARPHRRRRRRVEVVDLTPADLMVRLREGKVYVREQAQRPCATIFSWQPDGAARAGAQAHRRAGRRADAQLHARARHQRAVGGRRARSSSVSIPSPGRQRRCGRGARATGLNAERIALYVETDRHAALSAASTAISPR